MDDGTGYDLADPKHPTYHDRMAEGADLARKAARENAAMAREDRIIAAADDVTSRGHVRPRERMLMEALDELLFTAYAAGFVEGEVKATRGVSMHPPPAALREWRRLARIEREVRPGFDQWLRNVVGRRT